MPPITVSQALTAALQHHQAGRLKDAETLYRQILAVQPNHADALHFLGVVAYETGRRDLAEEWIQKAIIFNPNSAAAHSNLGKVFSEMRRLDEAAAAYRRALQLDPNLAEAEVNLGNVLKDCGHWDEAVGAYRRAIQLQPTLPEGYFSLANALQERGFLEEAVAAYRHLLQIHPNFPEAHFNLGNALQKRGHLEEAVAAYRRALQLEPAYPGAHNNLGIALARHGGIDAAVEAYRQALQIKPDLMQAYDNLGRSLKEQGLLDEAIAAYRQALQLQPDWALAHSHLIYLLHLHPEVDEMKIAEEHARWNRQFAEPVRRLIQPHTNGSDPERRLRIGYVSPDFRAHPVAVFFTPLLEAHDRRQCEIYCYSHAWRADSVTLQLRRSADVWREVSNLSDVQLADSIRADGIDILVDLAMHCPDNRLPVFAHRPAPVQVSWLGYPGSPGMAAIDYRLTDARMDPVGKEDRGAGEEVVRLPDSWCCYAPISEFPPVGPLPAAQSGTVTFGSFNEFRKIHEGLLHCWARLLESAPDSRLLMICPKGQCQDRTQALFAAHGIARERVELIAPLPWPEFIRLFARVDVALDSYPCNGMTTTCHALWMGVPVVTRAGTRAMSRAGDSLLHAMGLPEWVVRSEEEYIRVAIERTADLPRLAALRATLRARMQASPLMDGPRFARNVEAAYRTMWRCWCARETRSASPEVRSFLPH